MTYVITGNTKLNNSNFTANDILSRSKTGYRFNSANSSIYNNQKLASSASVIASNKVAFSSMQKTAFSGAGSNTIYGSPNFYSPIHTAVNWQIPTKRQEVYMWRTTADMELMLEDFTYKSFKDFEFVPE